MDVMPMTDEHIEKIMAGEKTSTLRTIKRENLYSVIKPVKLEHSDFCMEIQLKERDIVMVREDGIFSFDYYPVIKRENKTMALEEGFGSYKELLGWFKRRNYNIPQPMFRYHNIRMLDINP